MAKPTTVPAATTPTNAGASNKSAPAPVVAVPASVKKWLWLAVVTIAVIIGIALLVSSVKRDREKERVAQKSAQALSQQQSQAQSQYAYGAMIPMTSLKQSVWPNIGMQAGEKKSAVVEIPKPGLRVVVLGNNVKLHQVYHANNTECIVVTETNCPPGPNAFYVENTSEDMNIVSYAFK